MRMWARQLLWYAIYRITQQLYRELIIAACLVYPTLDNIKYKTTESQQSTVRTCRVAYTTLLQWHLPDVPCISGPDHVYEGIWRRPLSQRWSSRLCRSHPIPWFLCQDHSTADHRADHCLVRLLASLSCGSAPWTAGLDSSLQATKNDDQAYFTLQATMHQPIHTTGGFDKKPGDTGSR